MIDENAFGLLLSYFAVEEDEYALDETSEFVERFQRFQGSVLEILADSELPQERRCLCLGHMIYTEFHDAEDTPGLFAAVRRAAARLQAEGFENIAVLSHGSRWVEVASERLPAIRQEVSKGTEVVYLSPPSEPLRRALNAESMARPDDELGGWGAGLYVDTEALEALNRRPKNAPTVLKACGASFYRIPPLAPQPTEASA